MFFQAKRFFSKPHYWKFHKFRSHFFSGGIGLKKSTSCLKTTAIKETIQAMNLSSAAKNNISEKEETRQYCQQSPDKAKISLKEPKIRRNRSFKKF